MKTLVKVTEARCSGPREELVVWSGPCLSASTHRHTRTRWSHTCNTDPLEQTTTHWREFIFNSKCIYFRSKWTRKQTQLQFLLNCHPTRLVPLEGSYQESSILYPYESYANKIFVFLTNVPKLFHHTSGYIINYNKW